MRPLDIIKSDLPDPRIARGRHGVLLAAVSPVWQMKFTGWAWWVVVPLAIAAVWFLPRLYRMELAAVSLGLRRKLLALRATGLSVVLLCLLEPTLTRRGSERVLPQVAVVVDQSGSMAVRDELMGPGPKLSEAIGLGILPSDVRPMKTNATDQAASDSAVAGGAKEGSAVAAGLAKLASMSRYERAVKLARMKVVPGLRNSARVKVFGMDTGLTPLDLEAPSRLLGNRATDYEACLSALARTWAQDYVGGVVLVTDGRQTTGLDPLPVIRSLRARGGRVAGIFVGDPGEPEDAVVAEISGPSEVFVGERVPLNVRYRITGGEGLDWDLVVSQGGKELERRSIRGNGEWEYQSFAFAATNLGTSLYQARLEMAREQTADDPLSPAGSVVLELWPKIPGERVADLLASPKFREAAQTKTTLNQLEYFDRGEQYGARIRGFLVPPQSGEYTFWVGSDDASELWISGSESREGKVKVASVSGYVPQGKWDAQPGQKSQAITLRGRQPYYFETLHKQGSGDDYLAAGWRLPDGTLERPIPASRLSPYEEATERAITQRKQQAAHSKTQSWKEASVANNAAEFSVVVNQDPIQVLLVDSTPRWESRYLASMFERDRRLSFTRRYQSILAESRNMALLPKTQAEWDAYDMVCLGDLDSNELPPEQQARLANFVARRGGFLVCLAGPRGMPRAFSLGVLANLLPVRVALTTRREPEPVRVVLTPEGTEHPVMQVLNDAGMNKKLWPLLPPLEWIADTVVAKPSALVLLAAQNAARTPIVAAQRYGAGRVFWVGTEETWRWRDRLGERVHQTFWLQAMRWGLAGRLRGRDPRLQAGLDRYLMTPSESAELKVRVTGKNGEPVAGSPVVRVERLGDSGEPLKEWKELEMQPLPDAAGLWQLPLSGLDEGSWRISVSHRDRELRGLSEARDLIVRSQNAVEGLNLGGDVAGLTRMASAGGSIAGGMDQAGAIVRDFASHLEPRWQEHRQTIRLWDSYLALVAVGLPLGLEWYLRKRHGLP